MARTILSTLAAALVLAVAPARAADLSVTAAGGWQGGGVLRLTGTAAHLWKGVPLAFDLGVGHAFVDPGDAAAARRVFINENTDGTPEKSGGVWDFRADAVWKLKVWRIDDAGLFAGVRYSMFRGRFKYVGGNEDFTISSDAWGVGVGARATWPVTHRLAVTAALSLDWFPTQTLYGHDATYSSNNVNNGRENFTWSDANAAVNQPWLLPSFLVGMSWGL